MAGGFAVLKDISKMLVYRLANYRNSLAPVIPQRVITRAPSAELRPNQIDQDSLPPYRRARCDHGGAMSSTTSEPREIDGRRLQRARMSSA